MVEWAKKPPFSGNFWGFALVCCWDLSQSLLLPVTALFYRKRVLISRYWCRGAGSEGFGTNIVVSWRCLSLTVRASGAELVCVVLR